MVAIGERHLADMPRHRDRQASARLAAPVRTSAIASGPASPGTHASRIAAHCAAAHSSASGRPLTTTRTTGVPVATTASSSSCWRPMSPSSRRSRNSPVVESSVSPDRSPTTTIATSARGRARRPPRSPRRPVVDAGPARVEDLASREPSPKRVEDRPPAGQLVLDGDGLAVPHDAEGVAPAPAHLDQRLDVDQVAVVAEQLARAVRAGPDDRDPAQRRARAAARRRSRRGRASARPARGRPAPRRRPARPSCGLGRLDVRALEQAQPELHPQDAVDGRVEHRLVDAPGLEGGPERAGVGRRSRQLEVDAGLERQRRHDRRVVGQPVGGLEHLDADVVGGDDAVEPPAVAQDRP